MMENEEGERKIIIKEKVVRNDPKNGGSSKTVSSQICLYD